MQDLKPIIAKNITELRQSRKLTQIELADMLNYSDKAISKWERGESIPDVSVLKAIADLFNVTVDYLLTADHDSAPAVPQNTVPERSKHSHAVVTALSVLLVWLVATLCYVMMDIICPQLQIRWLPFAYAVPVSSIVWLVFNSIWFNRRINYWIISLLMWTTIAVLAITVAACGISVWQLFWLGVPGQVIIFVWSRFHHKKEK